MCTELYKAMSSYLQGTICRETPPLMQVDEIDLGIVELPDGYTTGPGTNGGRYGLLDENGEVCMVAPDWRSLI